MKSTKEAVTLKEVKKSIRALLISAPRGLSVEDIEHDYQSMFGKPLPFKQFNCKTALEFLKTMPDVVCPTWFNGILILKGIADESTKHIAKLVSRQSVNTRKSRRISKAPVSTKPLVVPNSYRRNIKELLSVHPNGILGTSLVQTYSRHYGDDLNYARLGFKSMSQFLNAIQDIATIVKNPKGGYRVVAIKKTPPVKKMSSLLPAPSSKPLTLNIPPSKSQSQNIPPSKTMISNTQMKAPPPANNNIIPSKHRTLTDFNSLDDNGSLIKDKKQNVEKVKDLLDSKSGVSDSMKDELISVLVKRPNGVWANRLSFEYKSLIGKDLKVLDMGFYSIIEMASAMPDIFRIERPFQNGDWLLFLTAKCRKDKNITKVDIPGNAVGRGVGYTQQNLPENFDIELYVTHIRTPDCFWIQLLKCATELEDLQKNMSEFYSSKESAKFMVDDSLVKLGQVCVAKFPVDHEWYRGLITAIPSQVIVEIFFVDYGNCSQVSKSDIRLMKKEFFQLPSQAIKSRLANVKPRMTIWDPSAAHRMNELTADKALVGLVSGKKDDVLDLFICDTNGKEDLHINDKLVEEGFAEFKTVNGRTTPPGLPVPQPNQKEINQQVTLNTMQQAPTFPDYSVPLNLFTSFPYDLQLPLMNMTASEPTLPQTQEEAAPVIFDEEKPSQEDIDFMRQVCEELSDASKLVLKKLNLPDDKVIHVIKFEEKPYVVRSEISALLWDSDLLRSMLRNVKKMVEKEVISREDHEELFDELRRLKVGDFANSEEVKEYASLYPLSTVPVILEIFDHPSTKLIQTMKDELASYEQNPETYWTEQSDNTEDGTDDSCLSESEEEHDLEELRLAEQALQFARKRILRAMTNGDLTPGDNIVDEAADVERRLAHIRELITLAEAKEAAARDIEEHKGNQTKKEEKDGVGDVLKEALPAKEERPAKPVGVTKPEIRQPSLGNNSQINQNPDILQPTHQHPLQYPNISTSTLPYPNISMSTSQNSKILDVSPPTSENTVLANVVSQYPKVPTSVQQYPNIPSATPQCPSVPTSNPLNPKVPNTIPQTSTETNTSLGNKQTFTPNDTPRSEVTTIVAPDGNKVHPGTSIGNQQAYKDLVQSSKQIIERITAENVAKQKQVSENSSKKRTHSSLQSSHHVTLPYPSHHPIGRLPLFMHAGHVTPLPPTNFPFQTHPSNVQLHGFLGPAPPFPSPAYPELMNLNGPLPAPNLVSPSHLLFQYGSPFPNNHPRRDQM